VPFKFKLDGSPNQDNIKGAKYYSQQGQIAYDAGHFEKAYDLFAQAVFLDSYDYNLLLNKAIAAINIGKSDEACSCILYLSSYIKLEEVKPYLKYCE
jgi:tetratricopeptide (TPR) repeat protein